MKPPIVILLGLFLCVAFPSTSFASYLISDYTARFEVSPNTSDVRVTLDITYEIHDEWKTSGFKFIGHYSVDKVSAEDENGTPLETRVDYLEETRITWFFPRLQNGTRRVIVHFTMINGLYGDLTKNGLAAPWIGVFKVPVFNAKYEFVFCDVTRTYSVWTRPTHDELIQNGVRVVQSVLRDKDFRFPLHPVYRLASEKGLP